MEGKTKLTHLYIKEHLIFYIHYIHTYGIKEKELTDMSQQLELYIYLFHKQGVC